MDAGDNFQGTVLGNCLPFLYTLCMLKLGITPEEIFATSRGSKIFLGEEADYSTRPASFSIWMKRVMSARLSASGNWASCIFLMSNKLSLPEVVSLAISS